ncbi:MAG: 16S rRNA (guanine(966)-N(2))-methyltransferase RsmD [Desulfobacca sp.]|uniref:16S rRNA (guanine(966)-N(2))-methyltransferase RsmD n=1 Tax=Desulfobacca sp. TaxID=2067990 RepID=UPI00404A379F
MRIIGGRLRGRRLAGVKGRLRPTADRVREAIFNILGDLVEGAQVLDLFAGTGALGIEALSRGASGAIFVEEHRTSLAVLRRNLALCGLTDVGHIYPLPVQKALPQLAAQGQRFTLILLDPPYEQGLAGRTLALVARLPLLDGHGIITVEHSRAEELAEAYEALVCTDRRRYGGTMVSFYQVTVPSPRPGPPSGQPAGQQPDEDQHRH